jgi:hypothetical protein
MKKIQLLVDVVSAVERLRFFLLRTHLLRKDFV